MLKTYDRWVPPVIEREENGQLVCVRDMRGRGVSEGGACWLADGWGRRGSEREGKKIKGARGGRRRAELVGWPS